MVSKKKKYWWIWLIALIAGVIFIIAGIIGMNYFNVSNKIEKEDFSLKFSENVTNLEIESGVCRFNIVKTNGDDIIFKGEDVPKGRYSAKVTDNTLKIKYNEKSILGFINIGITDKTELGELTLYLPEKEYDSIEFDSGVGISKISDLMVCNLEYDGGVGENYFDNVTVKNKAKFDLGVGETELTNCNLNKNDFDIGVGEITFSGKIRGDTNVDTGVGDVTLNIDGCKDAYVINVDKGTGNIDINEDTATGSLVPDDYEPDSIHLDLDCGVGDVTVNFN